MIKKKKKVGGVQRRVCIQHTGGSLRAGTILFTFVPGVPAKRKEVSILGKRVRIFSFAQQRIERGIETLR